jgi:hypothetical protein
LFGALCPSSDGVERQRRRTRERCRLVEDLAPRAFDDQIGAIDVDPSEPDD